MRWLRRLVNRKTLHRLVDRLAAELRAGAHEAAEHTAEEACSVAEGMYESDHPELVGLLHALASARLALGKLDSATAASTRAITLVGAGSTEPSLSELTEQAELIEIARSMQTAEAGEDAFERALAIVSRRRGGRSLEARLSHNYAVVCERQGKSTEAEALYRRALALAEAEHGPSAPSLRPTLVRLARMIHASGDFDGAATFYERALGIAEAEAAGEDVLRAIRVWLGDARTRTIR